MPKPDTRTASPYSSPSAEAPIMVGFDGAEGGRDALAMARALSPARAARCIVAIPDESLASEARAALEGLEVECRVVGALSPGTMLVDWAERERAGTLVLGSTRRAGLSRAMLGSTAEQVLRHSPCELVVAPRGYAARGPGRLTKIAVAVDGLEESKVALSRAEDLARQAGATIEVLVAEDPVVSSVEARFPEDAPSSLADVLEAAVDSVDPALSPTGRRIEPGWRQVAQVIAESLAEACGPDVDLLVAGAHKRLDHLLMGSVTKHLIQKAECPVLVVPHR